MGNRTMIGKAIAAVLMLLVVTSFVIGCDGTSSQAGSVVTPDNRPAPQPAAVTETLNQLVQARNGVAIQTSAGPIVRIPPSAISEDTTVTVEVLLGPGINPLNPDATPTGNTVRVTLKNGTFLQPFQVDFAANGLAAADAIGFTLVNGTFLAQPVEDAALPKVALRGEDMRASLLNTILRVTVGLLNPQVGVYEVGLLLVKKKTNAPEFWNATRQTSLEAAWPSPDPTKRYALVLHGINDDAKGITPLFLFLDGLVFSGKKPYDGIVIYQYDYTAGAQAAGDELYSKIKNHLDSKGAHIDIFAHSFGGLVSRYMAQVKEPDGGLRRISRVFMLGTPNDGIPVANLPSFLSTLGLNVLSGFVHWSETDQTIKDGRPKSDLLKRLKGPEFAAAKNQVGYYVINGDYFPQILGFPQSQSSYSLSGAVLAAAGGAPNDGAIPRDSTHLSIFDGMAFKGFQTFGWNHSDLILKISNQDIGGSSDDAKTTSVGNVLVGWIKLAPPPISGGSPSPTPSPTGTVTKFSVGGSVGGIAAGPDGNLWFAHGDRIGRITPTGTVTDFTVAFNSLVADVAAGPDGNLWFTEEFPFNNTGRIGRITPTGTVTEFTTGITAHPQTIAAGPDGNLWFTEVTEHTNSSATNTRLIGRITPTGTVTEFTTGITGGPIRIVAGPDGNLWFTEDQTGGIGRITPTGTVTEFTTGITAATQTIAAGPDGNLWFTEQTRPIGRITPTGTVTEFPTGIDAGRNAMVAGPDGNLWFTEDLVFTENLGIGRITPTGTVTHFTTDGSRSFTSGINGIVAGPDGNLWFTGFNKNNNGGTAASGFIGRIVP